MPLPPLHAKVNAMHVADHMQGIECESGKTKGNVKQMNY